MNRETWVDCSELEAYGSDGYCCTEFNLHLHEKEKIIIYEPHFRRYLLRASFWNTQTIYFCPWCGDKLPDILADDFFKAVEDQLGIFVTANEINKLPLEFQSDEWWKRRGL